MSFERGYFHSPGKYPAPRRQAGQLSFQLKALLLTLTLVTIMLGFLLGYLIH